jgi:hypothetical protein
MSRGVRPAHAIACALLLAAGIAGCGSAPPGGPVGPTAAAPADDDLMDGGPPTGGIDPALLAPLPALGPCPPTPEGDDAADSDLEGLVLPPTAVITQVNDNGPLTQLRGWVERTPVEVRAFYQDGSAGLEVLTIEDEVREAEVLVTDGATRLFVKAQAQCERGSFFVAFLAPASAADALPVPGQLQP